MTILLVAIAKRGGGKLRTPAKHSEESIRIKVSYSENTEARRSWELVTAKLLASVEETNYRIEKQLIDNSWFFAKGNAKYAFVVLTAHDYPMLLAVDCIDELSEATYHARSGFNCLAWNLRRKEVHKSVMFRVCIALYMKYSKNEPGCVLYEFRRMKNRILDTSAEHSEEADK